MNENKNIKRNSGLFIPVRDKRKNVCWIVRREFEDFTLNDEMRDIIDPRLRGSSRRNSRRKWMYEEPWLDEVE